jgi:hypothetical protein
MAEINKCDQLCPYNTLRGCVVTEKNGVCPLSNALSNPLSNCNACVHYLVCKYVDYEQIGCNHYKPKADVVEVRRGEWVFRNEGTYGRTRCYCTACGKHSGIGGIRANQLKPFCPNCGADMRGKKNDNWS